MKDIIQVDILELASYRSTASWMASRLVYVSNMISMPGIIVAMAVICHDFSDGLNTVTVMLRSGNSIKSSMRMLLLDAIAPVLGVVSTLFFILPEQLLVYILPFFAGGFLYLGASDLLPEAHEKNPPLVTLTATLLGFAIILIVTWALNV
jgi:ZIP family zinc transporter